MPHFATCLHVVTISARDPTLGLFSILAIMSKTPFSADYIHKLLKTIPESEREKFLVMLATQPIIEQQPASRSSGPRLLIRRPSRRLRPPKRWMSFATQLLKKLTLSQLRRRRLHPRGTPQRPRTKPSGPPAADPAQAVPPKSQAKEKVLPVNLNVHPLLLQMLPLPELAPRRFQTEATAFTLCTAVGTAKELKVSMAAEFFSLMTESSIPDNIREALASYDTQLFARSCNDQEELASLISHLMEASDTSALEAVDSPMAAPSAEEFGQDAEMASQLPQAAMGSHAAQAAQASNASGGASPGGATQAEQQLVMILASLQQNQQAILQMMRDQSEQRAHAQSSLESLRGKDLSKVLNAPSPFEAKTRDEELARWANWSWGLESWIITLDHGFAAGIDLIKAQGNNEIRMSALSLKDQERSQLMFGILSGLLHERGKRLLRSIPDRNGYEAYRSLLVDLLPGSRSRMLALLQMINQWPSFDHKQGYSQQMMKLEAAFNEYDSQSSTPLSEDIKIACLLRCVTGQLKQHLNVAVTDKTKYADLRSLVLRWDNAQTRWGTAVAATYSLGDGRGSSGFQPMDVDAIGALSYKGKNKGKDYKGKPKGKDYNNKGKSKDGKGKPQQYPKGKDQGKGWNNQQQNKGKNKGKGNVKNDSEVCLYCGKRGHWKRDCYKYKSDMAKGIKQVASGDDATTVNDSASVAASASTVAPSHSVSNAQAPRRISRFEHSDLDLTDLTEIDDYADADSAEECVLGFGGVLRAVQAAGCLHACAEFFDLAVDDDESGSSSEAWSIALEYSAFDLDSECLCAICARKDDAFDDSKAGSADEAPKTHDIILDSGADCSALPMSFAHVGVEDCEAMKGSYVDAQGNPLRTAGVRIAEVQVGELRFRERFVISDVTMPLISLGKLYRAGWYVLPDDGGLKLTNGRQGEAVCFKKQSLCIRGSIRIVQNQVIRAVTDVQLGSALSSLPVGTWSRLGHRLFVLKNYSKRFVDTTLVPLSELMWKRTTIVRRGGVWSLVEFNEDISSLDDRTALFEDSESIEQVITFAHSRGDLSPEDMFFEVPEVSPSAQIEAQQSAEPEPVAPASENPEHSELPVDQRDELLPPESIEIDGVIVDGSSASVISIDFGFLSRTESDRNKLTVLFAHDRHSKAVCAIPTPRKGGQAALSHMTTELSRFILWLGYPSIRLRSDNENSVVAVVDSVRKVVRSQGVEVHKDSVAIDAHQANGPVEQALQSVRQLACTLMSQLEAGLGGEPDKVLFDTDHPMWQWAVVHAAWIRTRFSVTQGCTPYERLTNALYRGKVCMFGEAVMAYLKQSAKASAKWQKAIWLGKTTANDVNILGVPGGIFVSRSVRRFSDCWDGKLAAEIDTYVWQHGLASLGGTLVLNNKKVSLPAQPALPLPVEAGKPHDEAPRSPSQVAGSDPERSSGSQMSVDFPDGVPDLEQIAAEAASTQQSDVADVLLPAIPEAVQLSENPRPQKQPRLETSTISMISTAGERSSGVDLIVGCEEMPCVTEIRKVTYTHEDESVELAFDQDAIDDMEDYDYEEYNDDQIGDAGDLDQRLCRPRDSDVEPECGEEEMRVLDSIADQVEITRLKSMSVLQDPSSMDLSQAVHLTTKMVRTWRQKETGNPPVPAWYRRSRYVAREYAWLSERTDLFSPASSSLCNRLLPILFMYSKSKDDNNNISDDDKLSLFAVDIGDAFLTVPQVRPTYVTYVHPDGSKELFYLGFVLPGQRSGSSDWYDDFTKFLSANLDIVECPAHPSLVKTADPSSRFAMQLHVDDMLGFAKRKFVHETFLPTLKKKYKVTAQLIENVGDFVTFLKRKHLLVSESELLLTPSPKHFDKLFALLRLDERASPKKTPYMPQLDEIDQSHQLQSEEASIYRSGIGLLLYL
ncbi:unnamed protein product, partial [Symbiodinium sp. KB8]